MANKVDNTMSAEDLSQLLNTIKTKRFSEWEKNWYESYEAFQNNHFVMYSRETRRLVNYSPGDQKFFIQIPKLTKQVRATINLISSLKLQPYIYPESTTDEAINNAVLANKQLGRLFDWWDIKPILADALTDAAIYPLAFVEPAYDPDRLVVFRKYDPFDISFYPMHITDPRDIQVIVKSLVKPIEDIQANGNYNAENRMKVSADDRYSQSDFKNTMFRDRSGSERVSKNGTAIISEAQIKERQADGSIKIRILTIWNNLELRNELTDMRDFSISVLRLQPGQLYQKSMVEYLLQLNRAYDLTFSRIQDFFFRMVKGGWLIRAGSGVKRMSDENGEMLIYKNQKPDPMQLPEPPGFSMDVFAMLGNAMDQFGVSSLLSSGTVPKGVRAGRMMDILRAQDIQNMSVTTDLYSAFLGDLMTKTLWVIADGLNKKFSFSSADSEGKYDTTDLISEDMKALFKGKDATCPAYVSRKMQVKVEVTYEDKVSASSQLETITELVKAGVLKPEALVKASQMDIPTELLSPQVTSIIDTEEYKILPPDIQRSIVQALMAIHSGSTLMDNPDWQKLSPDMKRLVLEHITAQTTPPVAAPQVDAQGNPIAPAAPTGAPAAAPMANPPAPAMMGTNGGIDTSGAPGPGPIFTGPPQG